ncbi:TetR/AcrR family transcriptional regulator [Georgenia satyanarayanai]|uniref:TetR/AcrR family transcriptional regulator n=1 Tax=Georgenia satyanarayanai TaxID=860221 RepID=UPI0012659BBC|nr:TetR/AcrR family transcriptional regulator [Georgenia satyanarayanai]
MSQLPDPISRRDRQRQTREALVLAGRAVFARDGYHRANLEVIAREAGFSKGAVYSNFENKAALFLAVLDANMEAALAETWDPFDRVEDIPQGAARGVSEEDLTAAMTGFALATLEFIATAARDETLRAEMATRMQRLLDAYTEVVRQQRVEGDPMSVEELGALSAALDQGAGLLLLSGTAAVDARLLRAGVRRLIDPRRAAEPGTEDAAAGPGMHDQEIRARIAASLREER